MQSNESSQFKGQFANLKQWWNNLVDNSAVPLQFQLFNFLFSFSYLYLNLMQLSVYLQNTTFLYNKKMLMLAYLTINTVLNPGLPLVC